MNRIQITLDQLSQSNRTALVSYIVAGDPSPAVTVPLLHQLVKSGTDIIELGVPFSDPVAEGPTIQHAHERALANDIGMDDIFSIVSEFRKMDPNTPIVLMGYANPIEWIGYRAFAVRAKSAGVDAVLTVDIPPEEAGPLNSALEEHGLYNIFLLAPTTTEARIEAIANMASGFLYYVSLKGVTGSASIDVSAVEEKLRKIRAKTDMPVCVGFGINNAETARAVADLADGIVIGSAIVKAVAEANIADEAMVVVDDFLSGIRSALDA